MTCTCATVSGGTSSATVAGKSSAAKPAVSHHPALAPMLACVFGPGYIYTQPAGKRMQSSVTNRTSAKRRWRKRPAAPPRVLWCGGSSCSFLDYGRQHASALRNTEGLRAGIRLRADRGDARRTRRTTAPARGRTRKNEDLLRRRRRIRRLREAAAQSWRRGWRNTDSAAGDAADRCTAMAHRYRQRPPPWRRPPCRSRPARTCRH